MHAGVGSGDDDGGADHRPMWMAVLTIAIVFVAIGSFFLSTAQGVRLIDDKSADGQRLIVRNMLADARLTSGLDVADVVRRVAGLANLRGAHVDAGAPNERADEVSLPIPVSSGQPAQYLVWTPYHPASSTFGEVAPYRLLIVSVLVPAMIYLLWRFREFAVDLDQQRRVARRLASRDGLTDLANRMAFENGLRIMLARAEKSGTSVALMLLDLNGFKQVNDRLGHAAGDAVLIEVGRRLRGAVEKSSLVARLGGDEFAIVMPLEQGLGSVFELALDLHTALAEPHVVDGQPVESPASIGIALSPEHGTELGQLTSRADAALYAAKARPDRPFLMYEPRTAGPQRAAA